MTGLDWRPLSGLIHAYREPAVAELRDAEAELAERGLRTRVKYTLHGYQAQVRAQADLSGGGNPPAERCESGWTGDRCKLPLFHAGPHSNEANGLDSYGPCVRCGEHPEPDDVAEVAAGIVHVACMLPGEEVA